LQSLLVKKATREQKRHLAATETTTNKAMEEQAAANRATHDAAMAEHLAQHTRATTLAAGAT